MMVDVGEEKGAIDSQEKEMINNIFEFDKNDKIINATVDYIMIFEDEEKAENYMNVLKTLDNELEIELDGNEIKLSSTKDYEEYDENKETLKRELEKDGYICK